MTINDKAKSFAALHVAGKPLVLCNVWDAGSARAATDAGASALATSSWAVAAAEGYEDGENLPMADVVRIHARIVAATHLPVSADIESGYAKEPKDVARNVAALLDVGVIGINFEDRDPDGGMFALEHQVARIAAIRKHADDARQPLFINARTDCFLQAPASEHADLVASTIVRADAYARAGANGLFVPGLTDGKLIAELCKRISLPLNVMVMSGLAPAKQLAQMGVSRISHGAATYSESMNAVQRYVSDHLSAAD